MGASSYHRRIATDGSEPSRGKESRHARGYGSAWEKARRAALERDRYLCQPCERAGRTTPATEVDHRKPKAKGGTDDLENLQSICRECHAEKTLADSGKRARPRIGLDGWPVA